MYLRLIYFTILCFLQSAEAFNIEDNSNILKYFSSPVATQLLKHRNNAQAPLRNEQSSFFGYNMKLYFPSYGSVSLLLSTPKILNPAAPHTQYGVYDANLAQGGLATCSVTRNIFWNGANTNRCLPIFPNNRKNGDAIGLSVSMDDNGNILACAPGRLKVCPTQNFVPGSCFKGSQYGKFWDPDLKKPEFECPVSGVDIMFVLDGSQSIGGENFEKVKSWVLQMIKSFNINDGTNRVGVVQYSHVFKNIPLHQQQYIRTEIELGKFRTFQRFKARLNRVRLHNYTTFTAHALNKTVWDFEKSERFGDPSVKQVLILVTDGKSSDSKKLPYSAEYVRSLGIKTYAVGVDGAVRSELREIATGDKKSNERVYYVSDFNDLSEIIGKLQNDIMDLVLEGPSSSNTANNKISMGQAGLSSSFARQNY